MRPGGLLRGRSTPEWQNEKPRRQNSRTLHAGAATRGYKRAELQGRSTPEWQNEKPRGQNSKTLHAGATT